MPDNKRNKIIPAAYLVLKKRDKILLSRRFNTGFEDGKFSLISGHVEKCESFTDSIIREAKEEANIDVCKNELKLAHILHRVLKEKNFDRIDSFFVAEKWCGELKNLECEKCDLFEWHDIDNLPDNTIDYVKRAISNISNNIWYDEITTP